MSQSTPDRAVALFRERFGEAPSVIVEAPGRVNLIGEHTDYSLLPVLPCAIDRSLAVAAGSARSGRVRAVSSSMSDEVDLPMGGGEAGGWGRYLSGALNSTDYGLDGLAIAVASDLPADAGLSSSSALTLALVGSMQTLSGGELDLDALVAAASVAERSVGIEGGTMDQEAIAHGVEGRALRIDFRPPSRTLIRVPEHFRIVIAHSGEAAAKSGAHREAYDLRVVGCRLAAALLGDHSDAPRLGHVAGAATDGLPEVATPLKVSDATGVAPGAFTDLSGSHFPPDAEVPVAACARHVLSEAGRVDLAEQALLRGGGEALGALLDASHRSLQEFGVSSNGLDTVVAAMRAGGAFGARLTGAGFGGFAVAVVRPEAIEAVIDAARSATGGPAFEVRPARGLRIA